jgi:hypothetical protein
VLQTVKFRYGGYLNLGTEGAARSKGHVLWLLSLLWLLMDPPVMRREEREPQKAQDAQNVWLAWLRDRRATVRDNIVAKSRRNKHQI